METQKAKHNLLLFVPLAFLFLSLIGTIYFVIRSGSFKSDKNRLLLKNDSLISEKWKLNYKSDSLLTELDRIKANHDSEITHMYAEIENKSKSFNYDASQTYYYKKLYTDLKIDYDKIKKQVDELFTENQSLKEEKLVSENNYKDLLNKYNAITVKTDSAKKIKCYDLVVSNQKKTKKTTEKSRKTKSSKISFLVAGNLFAETGSKTAYIVVTDPLGKVFGQPQNVFTLKDDWRKNNYTFARTFDFIGKDVTLNAEVKYTEKLKKGNYKVEIYIDGVLSGVSQFALK
ncbi:MAG: hypothetical protein V1904_14065 [Bacteroidota bacterium]